VYLHSNEYNFFAKLNSPLNINLGDVNFFLF